MARLEQRYTELINVGVHEMKQHLVDKQWTYSNKRGRKTEEV